MQILLASAKIMHDQLKNVPDVDMSVPMFQKEALAFARDMAGYSSEIIAGMLGCSQQIAEQNKLRFMRFFDKQEKLPAILTYHGQAYKHLKAETFTLEDMHYSQAHLWITSFLYGMLRPLDGILPYRMEGNVELPNGEGESMFGFWKHRLTDVLIKSVKDDDGILVHLATEEYQHLFDWQRVIREVHMVQPLFYVRKGNDLKMQAVWAKTCRGAMARFIIKHRIAKPMDLNAFSYEGFEWQPTFDAVPKGCLPKQESDFPLFIRK